MARNSQPPGSARGENRGEFDRRLSPDVRALVLGADQMAEFLLVYLYGVYGLRGAYFAGYGDAERLWAAVKRAPEFFPRLLEVPSDEVAPAISTMNVVAITTKNAKGWRDGAQACRRHRKPTLRLGWLPSRGAIAIASSSTADTGCCPACIGELAAPRTAQAAHRLAALAALPLGQLAAGTLSTGPLRGTNVWLSKARRVDSGWLDPNPNCPVCRKPWEA
jgi:hypothetical protein